MGAREAEPRGGKGRWGGRGTRGGGGGGGNDLSDLQDAGAVAQPDVDHAGVVEDAPGAVGLGEQRREEHREREREPRWAQRAVQGEDQKRVSSRPVWGLLIWGWFEPYVAYHVPPPASPGSVKMVRSSATAPPTNRDESIGCAKRTCVERVGA